MRRLFSSLLLPLTGALSCVLVGCGAGAIDQTTTGRMLLSGHVHGGMQPVSGATIELFAVGTGGNGSQATSLLTAPVMTDAKSYFSIEGDYTCPSANAQVYLVARGGNPGFAGNVNNPALVLMSAVGSCADLMSNGNANVWMNEVTTAGAVYALAPFMTAYDHVGASATNATGVANAFLNAQLLSNTATGAAATLPANLTLEQSKLASLADAIAPCVNSDGGGSCALLFAATTPAGGTAPTDVTEALLNIVTHPGNNVSAVFQLIEPAAPFGPVLTKAPHDWTMSLTVTGGGLFEPTGLGVDAAGNAWAANFGGPATGGGNNPVGVVAFSPQGAPMNSTPLGASAGQTEAYGLALDRNGDVWVTSEENVSHGGTFGSVAKILGVNSGSLGTVAGQFSDNSLNFPQSIATDPRGNGTVLIGNFAGNSATVYDLSGNFVSNVGSGSAVFPADLVSDNAGGMWLANDDYTLTHVLADGTATRVDCCDEAQTVALDPQGNVWVTNFGETGGGYSFSELSSSGAVLIQNQTVAGLSTPGGATVDAGGQMWVLNYHDGSFLGIAGNHAAVPVGTGLSPAALGKDAGLVEPYAVAPDASGDLWVSNRAKNSLVMFFGMATPTRTPATPVPAAP